MTTVLSHTRRAFCTGLAATIIARPANAQCSPVDLGIRNITQNMPAWCWLAAAQQVIFWATHHRPSQCQLYAMALNQYPAQVCTAPQFFDYPGHTSEIQQLIARFVGSYSTLAGPGSPEQVYRTVALRRPVIMLVNPSFSQIGHFVVIRGVSCYGPSLTLHINDPMNYPGFASSIPYAQIAQMWQAAIIVG